MRSQFFLKRPMGFKRTRLQQNEGLGSRRDSVLSWEALLPATLSGDSVRFT